jgi:RNA polymerase sigma-70 factor, ECF subfamily
LYSAQKGGMKGEQKFLSLIEEHKGILYKISRMYTDDEESRKDLFQELLYQLWRSFPSFKKESKFSTWMYRVALNTAITALKKEKKKLKYGRIEQALTVSSDTNESSRITWFYETIQQFSKIEKAVIFLYLENFSHKEIGIQLGISEGNARVRLNRVKNKLKDILKNTKHEF